MNEFFCIFIFMLIHSYMVFKLTEYFFLKRELHDLERMILEFEILQKDYTELKQEFLHQGNEYKDLLDRCIIRPYEFNKTVKSFDAPKSDCEGLRNFNGENHGK